MIARFPRSWFQYSIVLIVVTVQFRADAKEYAFYHENVLGTSLERRIETDDKLVADRAEEIALHEIDRLVEVFSHYSKSSEFAKLTNLPIGESMSVSPDLARLLQRCEKWTQVSDGAFNPGAEFLSQRWKRGTQMNQLPTSQELQHDLTVVKQRYWTVHSDARCGPGSSMLLRSYPLSSH